MSLTSAVEGMIGYLRKPYIATYYDFYPPVCSLIVLLFIVHYGRQVE
jgi:hypothetical protein